MTAVAPGLAGAPASARDVAGPPLPEDAHAAKIAPDDPRLRLRRTGGRTLRTGPLALLLGALLGSVVLAAALAFDAPSTATHGAPSPSGSGTPAAPTAPAAIRNASEVSSSRAPSREPAPRARTAATRASPASVDDEEERARRAQALQAQGAPILFAGTAGGGEEKSLADGRIVGPAAGATAQGASLAGDTDPNFQGRKNAFLDSAALTHAGHVLAATLEHPVSPYELLAGTVIPAVLLTAINSDLPGPVVGQVRENVYDSVSGNALLVPQGSRLLAHYDSMVAWGQERVLVCWNRLLLPNGDSLDLECMPAADLKGAAGLTDEVDEHWFRILKGAAVASLLAATTEGIAGSTTGFNPTVPQLWASNAAGDINQMGQQLTRRNLTVQPTITVRPGFSVNVMVTRDIVLPPYPDAPAAAEVVP